MALLRAKSWGKISSAGSPRPQWAIGLVIHHVGGFSKRRTESTAAEAMANSQLACDSRLIRLAILPPR